MNWTCCKCENKYDNSTGDVDERMCDECLDDGEEVILEIKKSIQELHPQPIAEVEEVEHQ
jgi:hypothetical protein